MPNDESSKALALAPAHSRGCRDGSAIDWIRDAAVVERIIAAVRTVVRKTEFEKEWELNLDRNWLVSDLLDAGTKWRLFTALDSDKGARERAKLFSAISDKAKDFKECLLNNTDQRYAARQIASTFSNASDFDAFLAGLDHTIETAETLTQQNKQGGWVRLSRPPNEWFAAEILPPIFERNFGRRAGVSRKDPSRSKAHSADSPFIRFAVAVMREMGMQISAETVARALKDVRAGRERRQPRKTTLSRPPGW